MKKSYMFVIAGGLSLFVGCTTNNSGRLPHGLQSPKVHTSSDYGDWARDSRAKLNIYLGSETKKLKENFGEPTYVEYDVPFKRKHYDEVWFYCNSEGIPLISQQTWSYAFYINNGVVEYIHVF